MLGLKVFWILIILLNFPVNIYADNKDMKTQLNPVHFKEINFKQLLEKRSSIRDFQEKALNFNDVSALLWVAYGKKQDAVTEATRTIPSAGATYPLELYLVVGKNCVDQLKEGIYHYLVEDHALELIKSHDKRAELASACLGQYFIQTAPISLVIAAQFQRTASHYGARGEQYVYMEAGHACQNIYLAATCLDLATVEVGAFFDDKVAGVLDLKETYVPLSVMPVGYPKRPK